MLNRILLFSVKKRSWKIVTDNIAKAGCAQVCKAEPAGAQFSRGPHEQLVNLDYVPAALTRLGGTPAVRLFRENQGENNTLTGINHLGSK